MRVRSQDSTLIIVDVQENLAPAILAGDRAIDRVALLLKTALRLAVPVIFTEHYPKGLGTTLASLGDLAPEAVRIEKISFSALGEGAFERALRATGRPQVVLAGMETHVCVLQTGLALREAGYEVFVAADACGSRRAEDKDRALQRLAQNGAQICTAEMLFFEWLHHGASAAFKELLPLVK